MRQQLFWLVVVFVLGLITVGSALTADQVSVIPLNKPRAYVVGVDTQLRAEAHAKSESTANACAVERAMQVEIIERKGGWLFVLVADTTSECHGQTGWLHSSMTQKTAPLPLVDLEDLQKNSEPEIRFIPHTAVSLRSQATTDSERIGVIEFNTRVKALPSIDNWAFVEIYDRTSALNGQKGWALARFLKSYNVRKISDGIESPPRFVVGIDRTLRSKPSRHADYIEEACAIERGASVLVKDQQRRWLNVFVVDHNSRCHKQTGWLHETMTSTTRPLPRAVLLARAEATQPVHRFVPHTQVVLRVAPSFGAASVGVLEFNVRILAKPAVDNWAHVTVDDAESELHGKSGYISAYLVKQRKGRPKITFYNYRRFPVETHLSETDVTSLLHNYTDSDRVGKTLDYMYKRIGRSKGLCARYVREGLQHTGLLKHHPLIEYAKNYHPYLAHVGWTNIYDEERYPQWHEKLQDDFFAMPNGCVVTYDARNDRNDRNGHIGHIEVRNKRGSTKRWGYMSDYRTPYPRTKYKCEKWSESTVTRRVSFRARASSVHGAGRTSVRIKYKPCLEYSRKGAVSGDAIDNRFVTSVYCKLPKEQQ